ncbi:MAG: hypothetical protein QOD84_1983 [Acidobacteriaceae bacterium]|jgi:hypothetical protein
MVPKKGLPAEQLSKSSIIMGNPRVHEALKMVCPNPGLSSTLYYSGMPPIYRAIPRYELNLSGKLYRCLLAQVQHMAMKEGKITVGPKQNRLYG